MMQTKNYSSSGFWRSAKYAVSLTTQELEEFESFVLGWLSHQQKMGYDINRVEFRKFVEGVRENSLSDLEFGMFLGYFKDRHDIEIPD